MIIYQWGKFHSPRNVYIESIMNPRKTWRINEDPVAHTWATETYLLARSDLSEPAITTTQSFSTAIFVPTLDKSAIEPTMMITASSNVMKGCWICCSSSSIIKSKTPQMITATFWTIKETRATKIKRWNSVMLKKSPHKHKPYLFLCFQNKF